MSKVGFDPSKLNKLRDDWMIKYNQANQFLTQFQNNQFPNRFNSPDADDPMSKYGSVFRAEGINGAGAAQNSSSTVNNNQNTTYDSTTQQMPTGQNTIVTGSGTTMLSSSIKDTQSGDNQGGQSDLSQKKQDAKQQLEESRNKYFSYLEVALNYEPNVSNGGSSVFTADNAGGIDSSDNKGNGAVQLTSENKTSETDIENKNPTAEIDENDASDPTKTDMAYQQPDNENESVDEQTLKKQIEEDQKNQQKLEAEYKQFFEQEEDAA